MPEPEVREDGKRLTRMVRIEARAELETYSECISRGVEAIAAHPMD
ncbi:hypothetical protein [Kocuria arenosa]